MCFFYGKITVIKDVSKENEIDDNFPLKFSLSWPNVYLFFFFLFCSFALRLH